MNASDDTAQLEYLSSLSPSSIRLGLDRVERALGALERPERAYPSIHVAGTNGKGSTCAYLSAALAAGGYRVGRYTSPHLLRVNERITVNGADVTDAALASLVRRVRGRLGDGHELSYFEFLTVLAFVHFADERVDIAVLETGLGGRLDATNVVTPLVCVITSISLDHQSYLGDTIPEIAGEKAGIIKPGVPVVAASSPEAVQVFERVARERGAPLYRVGAALSRTPDGTLRGRVREYAGLRPSLRGEHQWENALLAIGALEVVNEVWRPVSEESIRAGVSSAVWPARFEVLAGRPTVVIDGAHNPDGIAVLLGELARQFPGRTLRLIFGVLRDKPWDAMVAQLRGRFASVDLTALPSDRSLEPSAYLGALQQSGTASAAHASVERAFESALGRAGADDVVVVGGSLILAGLARAYFSRFPREGKRGDA